VGLVVVGATEGGIGPEDAGVCRVGAAVDWRCEVGVQQLQRKARQKRVQQKKGAAKSGVPAGSAVIGKPATTGVPEVEEGEGRGPEADATAHAVKAVLAPARTV